MSDKDGNGRQNRRSAWQLWHGSDEDDYGPENDGDSASAFPWPSGPRGLAPFDAPVSGTASSGTASPSFPASTHHHERYGCACCADILSDVSLLNTPALYRAGHAAAWRDLGPPPAPATGTKVFLGATVMTVDQSFSIAEALAIRDDKILAVGARDAVLAEAGDEAEIIAAEGKTILPGFIEPHMHFFPIAILGRFADVGALTCPTVASVLERVRDLVEETPFGLWVVARQFDPSLQEGPDELTADMLDAIAPDTPVFIFNASLHIAYCNSAALKAANVSANTPDPAGASYGRDADGRPNGVLRGQATMFTVLLRNPGVMELEDVPGACAALCRRANSVGVTTFCDQASGGLQGMAEIDIFRAFAASGHMSARLRYSLINTRAALWDDEGAPKPGDGDAMQRAVGWKIVSDGSNQGRTGFQRAPYLGLTETGMAYIDEEALHDQVKARALQGWQVVVHANGDAAIDRALDAFEGAYAAGASRELRFRLEHCSILHDEQIERISALGVSPSFLIGHVHYWGKAFRDEIFGPEKADLLGRAASCAAKNIPWTAHSDEPVTPMGPMRLIHNAVTREMWKEPGQALNPKECVSVEQAIVALTRDAAWQCHSEHEIGSLEAGKFADFVVLDQDPRQVPPESLKDMAVSQTWMNGRLVYSATDNPRAD